MFYLGIDQHKSQLTVNVRNEDGETIFKRQVSTPGAPGSLNLGGSATREMIESYNFKRFIFS
jgi:hypothetical protein